MSVRVISISQPIIPECDTPGSLIAYCARVSNPDNQANQKTAPYLLQYLIRHGHWSPFEMVSVTLEIITSRTISRQIIRHKSFSFQEFSQRYAECVALPIISETRMQDAHNRQSSLPTNDDELKDWWRATQVQTHAIAANAYKYAIERGIAKEVARNILPEGITQSVLYVSGTVRSWLHYIQRRTQIETQKEHRQIAFACRDVLLEQIPELAEAFND